VALNSTPSIALHKEAEVALGTMGIGLDYGCRLVAAKPETSSDNFLRDFGERFVPGYKPISTVDLLMNAPFEE
jgi:hypothetical protein